MLKIVVVYLILLIFVTVQYGTIGIGVFNAVWLTAVLLRRTLRK